MNYLIVDSLRHKILRLYRLFIAKNMIFLFKTKRSGKFICPTAATIQKKRVQKSVFLGSLNDIKMKQLRLFLQQQLGSLMAEENAKDNLLILSNG